MITYSFFNPFTGYFTGSQYTGSSAEAAALLDGLHVMEGSHDHLRYRVNLDTGEVEEYQPEQPASTDLMEYTWDADKWRWLPQPTLHALQLQRVALVDQAIQAQEARRIRPASEAAMALASGQPVPQAALVPLQQTEAALQQLRAVRQAIELASSQAELDAITWP